MFQISGRYPLGTTNVQEIVLILKELMVSLERQTFSKSVTRGIRGVQNRDKKGQR